MPAIPRHKTATSNRAWDGPANEARLKTGQDYNYYRKAYAWRDPEGDESNKSTYKFIHHEVSADGTPGPANIKGCISGIGVLNGAMGGTNIPKADYEGVYNHLASHLKDADVEPPELKRSLTHEKEIRMMDVHTVLGAEEGKMVVEGYAIRFGEPAIFKIGDEEYREIIDNHALDNTDLRDVPFKYNHSDNIMIMARTRNKTLQLIKDEQGLKIAAELANTTAGRDLYELIKRGDIDKMSFAFTVRSDKYNRQTRTRTILDIDKLYDVSAVDTPAYNTTSIAARSFLELESEEERKAMEMAELRKRALLTSIKIINLIYGGNIDE
jgi:hypothetical protein